MAISQIPFAIGLRTELIKSFLNIISSTPIIFKKSSSFSLEVIAVTLAPNNFNNLIANEPTPPVAPVTTAFLPLIPFSFFSFLIQRPAVRPAVPMAIDSIAVKFFGR